MVSELIEQLHYLLESYANGEIEVDVLEEFYAVYGDFLGDCIYEPEKD